MLKLHPEEQTWLDEYRKALLQQQPGAVARMLIYGSKARGDAARIAILMCSSLSGTRPAP